MTFFINKTTNQVVCRNGDTTAIFNDQDAEGWWTLYQEWLAEGNEPEEWTGE